MDLKNLKFLDRIKHLRLPRYSLRLRMFSSIFAIVALFTLTNITYQISGDSRNQRLDNLQKAVQGQLSSVTIRQDLNNIQKEILVLDALKEAGEANLSAQEIESGIGKLQELRTAIEQLSEYTYPESQDAYNRLSTTFDELDTNWRDYYSAYLEDDKPDTTTIEQLYNSTIDELATFEALEVVSAEQKTRDLQSLSRFSDRVTLIIYLFTILLTVGLGYLLIRYTTSALRNLQNGTEKLGRGNLDFHIPVTSNDEIGDLAHAFNDMSDKLRNAMAQVQQSKEKADQANRAKTNFLANMSHELRTPLNAIIGYSEMNIDVYAEENQLDQKQAINDLHHILDSGRHLLQLINDVLDLAKIESGNMTVFNETFSSVDILEEIMKTMTPLANKNNNKMQINAEEELPPLFSDSIKFRQIFINLLSNACKFTSDGEITISAKIDPSQSRFVYEVKDTGIGMTREQLENIFDAFVQADTSTSKVYGGTGLGLAICKEFIELMQGALDVKSAPGVGTSFIVSLPQTVLSKRASTVIPTSNQQELDLPNLDASSTAELSQIDNAGPSEILLRCSKEITNVLFLNTFPAGTYELIPLDNLNTQINQINIDSTAASIIELSSANRKSFNQGWSEVLLLHHTCRETFSNFVVMYHQLSTGQRDKTPSNPVVRLSSLEFLHEEDSNEIASIAARGEAPVLIQRLRQLNPVGRRGQAVLAGYTDQYRHIGDRLQIEMGAEAWQCQALADTAEVCSLISSARVDVLVFNSAINDSDARQILDSWFATVNSLKQTHPDRRVKVYILDAGQEPNEDNPRSSRLLENNIYEIVPVIPSPDSGD